MDNRKIESIFRIIGLYILFVFFAYFMGKYASYIVYYVFKNHENRDVMYKSYIYLIMSISLFLILLLILYLCKLKLKDIIKFSKFNVSFMIKLLIFQYAFMFVTTFISWNHLVSILMPLNFGLKHCKVKDL